MKTSLQLMIMYLVALLFGFNCTYAPVNINQQPNAITLNSKIALPNVSGRIDHIAYDATHHLAFVAALGNNSVEVININTKQLVHSIKGLKAPQGLAYISSLNRLAIANDDDGKVIFFDMNNYKPLAEIDLKNDADNMRYDADKNLIYVGYGSGGIAIIDATAM